MSAFVAARDRRRPGTRRRGGATGSTNVDGIQPASSVRWREASRATAIERATPPEAVRRRASRATAIGDRRPSTSTVWAAPHATSRAPTVSSAGASTPPPGASPNASSRRSHNVRNSRKVKRSRTSSASHPPIRRSSTSQSIGTSRTSGVAFALWRTAPRGAARFSRSFGVHLSRLAKTPSRSP